MKNKKNKILISGWYGNNNVGDETILSGMLSALKLQIPNQHFLVFSDNPTWTEKNYNVSSFYQWPKGIKRGITAIFYCKFWRHFLKLIQIIRKSDLFILGGGGLLQHNNFGVIPFWLSKLFLAQLLKKPTVLYAIGVGKNKRVLDKFLIKLALRKVRLITVRDKESKKILINFYKIKSSRIKFTADPALFIKPVNQRKQKKKYLLNNIKKDKNLPQIGVVLLPLWSTGKDLKQNTKSSKQLNFNNIIAQSIDNLLNNINAQIFLLAENYREDNLIIKKVYNQIKNREKVFIVNEKFTVQQNLGFISQLDLLISMRLHPLIAASLAQTPVIGIIAHSKVSNFLSQIEQEKYGIYYNKLSPEILYNKVEQSLKNKKKIESELEKNTSILRKKTILNAKLVEKILSTNNSKHIR